MIAIRLHAVRRVTLIAAAGIQVACHNSTPISVAVARPAAAPIATSVPASASATFGMNESVPTLSSADTMLERSHSTSSDLTTHEFRREPLQSRDAKLTFHLVAELPDESEFVPLGPNALLAASRGRMLLPLVIEANQLRALPELARLDDPPIGSRRISVARGTWPDNTWLALSAASDAGPSFSDLYRWVPGDGWVKRHEYSPWVFDIVPWNDDVVILSKCEACAVANVPNLDVRRNGGRRLRRLEASACQLPAQKAPLAWVQDDTLSLFGYECDAQGNLPEGGNVLVMDTWSRNGSRKTRRLALPKASTGSEQVFLKPSDATVWFPAANGSPGRLARFDEGEWTTVVEVPTGFVALPAPNTADLWGVVDGTLLLWDDANWTVTELPRESRYRGIAWKSVWRRSAKDIWLTGAMAPEGNDPSRYFLFNTADGSAATHLLKAPARGTPGDALAD